MFCSNFHDFYRVLKKTQKGKESAAFLFIVSA